jgi:hypothetical protein
MRLMILAAAAVLAGCATQPQPRPVTSASNVELCEAVMYGPGDRASIPLGEIARRGIDCRDYAQAIQQAQQNRAQAAQILLGRPAMQPYQLQPHQMPQQRVCRSVVVGNAIETRCN